MVICVPTSTSKTQYYINQAYADYVQKSGYYPIMVSQNTDPLKAVDICDGLLLPGGQDIDPTFYDEDNVHSLNVDPEKDDFERALLHAFIDAGKPVFGICRGFQLIVREYRKMHPKSKAKKQSVYYQHINDHALATSLDLPRTAFSHSIYADRNFLYGEEHKTYRRMFVNSMHHQALLLSPSAMKVNRRLDGLIVVGTTVYGLEDSKSLQHHRVAEAITVVGWGKSRIMAVQWHPEELKDIALLKTFFDDKNGTPIELAQLKKVKPKVKTAEKTVNEGETDE